MHITHTANAATETSTANELHYAAFVARITPVYSSVQLLGAYLYAHAAETKHSGAKSSAAAI